MCCANVVCYSVRESEAELRPGMRSWANEGP